MKPPANATVVSGEFKLPNPLTLDGLWPRNVPDGASYQITAELPDGSIEPLLWLENYKPQFGHPFILRTDLELPARTVIRGVPPGGSVALLPHVPVPEPPAVVTMEDHSAHTN